MGNTSSSASQPSENKGTTNLSKTPSKRSRKDSFSGSVLDAPPSYSPRKSEPSEPDDSVVLPDYSRYHLDDRDLRRLSEYDTIFVVDDSGSMDKPSYPGFTRWQQACAALAEFADISAPYDTDGIDIHFINSKRAGLGIKSQKQVEALFQNLCPNGRTDIGKKLGELLKQPLLDLENAYSSSRRSFANRPKPRNYIVITDGQPTDPIVLERFLLIIASKLHSWGCPQGQIGFQFVQIGADPAATKYLEQLDGDRKRLSQDIVDTVMAIPSEQFSMSLHKKVLLGGINRHFDRNR